METTASASLQKVSRTGAIPNLHGSVSHLRSGFILHCAQRMQLRKPTPFKHHPSKLASNSKVDMWDLWDLRDLWILRKLQELWEA